MDRFVAEIKAVWERFINLFASFARFVELAAWAVIDRFVPEAREGYPYVLRSVISTLAANASQTAFNAADLTNTTADEFVVDHFRFEAGTDDGIFATGGTAGSYPGSNDYSVKVKVKDLSHNADLMPVSIEVGLLLDPKTRQWKPKRQIILRGGQNAGLQVTADNTTGSSINNVYCAVHGYMRSRKNTPQ